MKKLTQNLGDLSLLGLLLIGIFFIAYVFSINLAFSDKNQSAEKGEKIQLYPSKTLTYNFQASRDNLAAIRIRLSTDELAKNDRIKIIIKDPACASAIREKSLTPFALESDIFANFNFEPITDSNGKFYCLEISYLTDTAMSQIDKLPYVYLSENPDSPAEKVRDSYLGKEYKGYSLLLKKAYKNSSAWQNLQELTMRISQYKPPLLKNIFLEVLIVSYLTFSIFSVIILLKP